MGSALFVSATLGGEENLKKVLRQSGLNHVETATSAGEARRKLPAGSYQLVLINLPLPDEAGRDLAIYAAERSEAAVIVLVGAGMEEAVGPIGRDYGVYVMTKPLNRPIFQQALHFIAYAQKQIRRYKDKNEDLACQLREEREAGRAKCYLAQYEGMTEAAAHRYLETEAMKRQTKRSRVVAAVIDRYGEKEKEEENK